MNFTELGLGDNVLRAVDDAGYVRPTPIQEQAIPTVLMGRDILGCAQTGTGKTASFTLPMIDILANGRAKARMPRSLILEPTRELASQVAENFDIYGKYHKLNKALLIGGTNMREQQTVLDRGADVLIATPGRLLDMFERGHLLMNDVKILVIDEADRMLDMGFIPDVEKIVSLLSPIRQTLFFSATLAPAIRKLADKFLLNPKEITVAPLTSAAETVTQGLLVVPHMDGKRPGGGMKEKRAALREFIARENVSDSIIFCNRKRDISVLFRSMQKRGYSVGQLHGDMSQPARMEMLRDFKDKKFTHLICSDVAARGLDIPALSHVFNFDVPTHAEDYVHRIGRTGRAGLKGHAYTIAVPQDAKYIAEIEKLIGREIPRITLEGVTETSLDSAAKRPSRGHEPQKSSPRDAASANSEEPGSENAPKKRRRRRSSKRADTSSGESGAIKTTESPTRDATTTPPKDTPKAKQAPRTQATKSRGGAGRSGADDVPARNHDHLPAFLTRPISTTVKKKKKKPAAPQG
ncbi:DEAD/DEAH box helicase [Varunaivibrio sulfuroxidans]|uniref:DEAD-box ATP-dependent RNA helicase RhpA n=1 Tax=Varunaivibrio sulfuroxidans TaxID=1773489 RepID=A0A4R3JEK7_9PROT|nr:DEAD/DEAH box helicase [Varunaivibrio sulfuroxidans]TCS64332.1 superfamily II DNA/RNA helicase [Varunaivibrio sulfuroxidans]WES31230.1 DEAD/DEAH box helicase [Varunaivibrio sulfuroxidans]